MIRKGSTNSVCNYLYLCWYLTNRLGLVYQNCQKGGLVSQTNQSEVSLQLNCSVKIRATMWLVTMVINNTFSFFSLCVNMLNISGLNNFLELTQGCLYVTPFFSWCPKSQSIFCCGLYYHTMPHTHTCDS